MRTLLIARPTATRIASAALFAGSALGLLSACGGVKEVAPPPPPLATPSDPLVAPLQVGRMRGVLAVAAADEDQATPTAGTVTFTGDDGSKITTPVDPERGSFWVEVAPGTYRIAAVLDEGPATCTPDPEVVDLAKGATVGIKIICDSAG